MLFIYIYMVLCHLLGLFTGDLIANQLHLHGHFYFAHSIQIGTMTITAAVSRSSMLSDDLWHRILPSRSITLLVSFHFFFRLAGSCRYFFHWLSAVFALLHRLQFWGHGYSMDILGQTSLDILGWPDVTDINWLILIVSVSWPDSFSIQVLEIRLF